MPWTVVVLVIIAGAPLASGIVALFDPEMWGLAVVMLPLGLWLTSYLVPLLRGQVQAGGVYLSPQDVTYVKHGGWWCATWDEIVAATPGEPMAVIVEPGTGQRGRTSRWGWKGEVRSPAPDILGIETKHLALDPSALSVLINLYKVHPEDRHQLGAPESLTWAILRLDELRGQEALRRPGERAVE